jgi:hypothetical protein
MRGNRLWTVSAALAFAGWIVTSAWPQDFNLSPPATPVNLLWIHHSTGANWSHKFDPDGSRAWIDGVPGTDRGGYATRHDTSGDGGNGEIALYNSNYILHHLSYESTLADGSNYTDYRNWYRKFRSYLDRNDAAHYVNDVGGEDLVHCYAQDVSYSEQGTDEFTGANIAAQTNQVIMFKSCFPNSNISEPDISTGLPANPTLAQARAWVASASYTDWINGGGGGGPINYIKAEYMALLDVFGESRYRNILFVAWVAPPEIDSSSAYVRQLADWFENQWLTGYAYNNVLLFNYWNVHTGDHDATGTCFPAVRERHNHDRYNPFIGRRDYVGPGDPDFIADIRMAFPSGDSHPSHFGGAIACKESIHLLNIQWNRMKGIAPSSPTGYPTNGRTGFFMLDSTYTGALPSGATKGAIDGVSCLVFNGTANATLDLGTVPVVGTGGAFSYCFWYRPTVGSVDYPARENTVILSKEGVFACHHYAQGDADSHINTEFGGDYLAGPDHFNNVVDCDTWSHVAFVWDGQNGRHFMDGVQIIETSATVRTITDNSNHLRLGGVSGNLKGGIREVAIYNRALTPAEVRRIFQANAWALRTSARRWMKY